MNWIFNAAILDVIGCLTGIRLGQRGVGGGAPHTYSLGKFPLPQPSTGTKNKMMPDTKMCACAPKIRLHCRLS